MEDLFETIANSTDSRRGQKSMRKSNRRTRHLPAKALRDAMGDFEVGNNYKGGQDASAWYDVDLAIAASNQNFDANDHESERYSRSSDFENFEDDEIDELEF